MMQAPFQTDPPAAASLSALSRQFMAAGLCTHVYAAFGGLKELAAPKVVYQGGVDDRRIFDLASLTKALVTTPLVFDAIEKGDVTLDHTVQEWLGADALALEPPLRSIRIRDLLSHKSGLPPWMNFWMGELDVGKSPTLPLMRRHDLMLQGLNRSVPYIDPKRRPAYSDVGFILLGYCLEKRRRMDLAEQFTCFCRRNLGLEPQAIHCGFGAQIHDWTLRSAVVPTGFCNLRQRQLVGEVHDENAASLGGVSGHAGLFASGEGLGIYISRLLATAVGKRMVHANALARHTINNSTVANSAAADGDGLLGWRQGLGESARGFCSGRAIGHLGFTGTSFWLCPEQERFVMLLTNRVISGRLPAAIPKGISAFRQAIVALASKS